jgi:hypothetical protein
MKNYSASGFNLNSENIPKKVPPAPDGMLLKEIVIYPETEKDMNLKILNITMTINEQYPELSKFLEEMPVSIPDKNSSEITLINLHAYYDSLMSVLNKYILEHPRST